MLRLLQGSATSLRFNNRALYLLEHVHGSKRSHSPIHRSKTKSAIVEEVIFKDEDKSEQSSLAGSRLSRMSDKDTRPELVVQRPLLSAFKKAGFARDLLQWFKAFPHALLLVRVGQFYEVSTSVTRYT